MAPSCENSEVISVVRGPGHSNSLGHAGSGKDINLNGTLPAWDGSDEGGALPGLQSFAVSYNALSGTFPAGWASMTNMQVLLLDNNYFSGTLPGRWSSMTKMRYLRVNSNTCSHTVFSRSSSSGRVESMTSSKAFHIMCNGITGTLPAWGSMSQMSHLSVYDNALSGKFDERRGR